MKTIKSLLMITLTLLLTGAAPAVKKIDATEALKKITAAENGTARFVKFTITRFDKKNNKIIITAERRSEPGGSAQSVKFYEDDKPLFEVESSGFGKQVTRITPDGKKTDISSKLTEYAAGFPLTCEDIFAVDYVNQYSGAYLFSEKCADTRCSVFSLRPLSRESGYSRLVIWAAVSDNLIRRIDFYEKKQSTRSKTMSAVAIRSDSVKGSWRAVEEWVDLDENDKAEIRIIEFSPLPVGAPGDGAL